MSPPRKSRGTRARTGWYGALGALAALGVLAQASGCGTRPSAGSGESAVAKPATTTGSGYVPIARGAHPLARSEYDVGPLDPNKRIANLSVVFKPTPEQLSDRNALRDALTDPTSPSYHQWLTTAQYAARFGARAGDLARTSDWLAKQGLTVHEASPLGARVTFSGRVADLQTAFHAEMRQYRVAGATHYAMSTAPSIPAELADVVLAIHHTHDFHPRSMLRKGESRQVIDGGLERGLGPKDWAAIYDVDKLYATGVNGTPLDGTGVNIAIVGIQEIAQSDIDAFRATFGLAQKDFTPIIAPNTGVADWGPGGMEAVLDVEWSNGIAPGAHVDYFNTGVDDDGDPNASALYAIEQNIDSVLSESFLECEALYPASEQDVWDVFGSAANLLGITFLAASGDWGAAECSEYIGYSGASGLWTGSPANFPGVTAVGGTEFPSGSLTYGADGIVTGYGADEVVWLERANNVFVAGGGGISNIYARPAYQSLIPTCTSVGTLPTNVTPSAMRQVPDIALTAGSIGDNNPYWIECSIVDHLGGYECLHTGGFPSVFGLAGTSASAPSFAGVVALLNQATGGRLGNINPMLYTLARTTPSAFHDITSGNNEMLCASDEDIGCPGVNRYGYAATTGYDCATGLGSIDAYNLVRAWAALTPTTTAVVATPTALSEGTPVTLTATVGVTGTNAHALAGSVTFSFQSYGADGYPDLSWTLATKAITNGLTTGGTVEASVLVPAGIAQGTAVRPVDVVATYGGDEHHLASTSAKTRLTFAASGFCVSPSTAAFVPGGVGRFVVVGGRAPVRWVIDPNRDTTYDFSGNNRSSIDAKTGVFTAGTGNPGYVLVTAFDQYDTYSVALVTVGEPTKSLLWSDAGAAVACGANEIDGGVPPLTVGVGAEGDAGLVVAEDGGIDEDVDAATGAGGCRSSTRNGSGCSSLMRPSMPQSYFPIYKGSSIPTISLEDLS